MAKPSGRAIVEAQRKEINRLRDLLKEVHEIATWDEEERGDEPSEDDMIDALCRINRLTCRQSRDGATQPKSVEQDK